MSLITAIRHARLPDRDGTFCLRLANGRIAAIEPEVVAATDSPAEDTISAAGGLVTAALVDAHLHLDLAYTLDQSPPNESGTLLEAIGIWSREKAKLTAADVCRGALRAICAEVAHGTGVIRSHVDVASSAGLRLAGGVLEARAAAREFCDVRLVAFPQDGLIRDPGAVEQLRESLRMGVDLVGGIPHIERTREDGLRHLALVFDIAEEFDRDIDVHIDETDDPSSRYTEHLAALTIERGRQGRVTASHVCALASYDEVHAARVMDLIAEARIHVVTNPGVNLHLQGRFDRYPIRRGLTRVRDLLARGVLCAAGQDCIRDVFYPLGNGCLLDQAHLLVHAEHMSTPAHMRQAFEMVCGMAGRIVLGAEHAVAVGAAANLVAFDATTPAELVRERPKPRWVLHAGREVYPQNK
jgi:cytosine/creatinine deaminase